MKPEVAKKWVSALRSGKYKQGKAALKYTTKNGVTRHCCLGVLCELYNQDKKKKEQQPLSVKPAKEFTELETPTGSKAYSFAGEATMLPTSVRKWAGMMDRVGEIHNEGDENDGSSLAELNDAGASFKKIAQIIEDSVDVL